MIRSPVMLNEVKHLAREKEVRSALGCFASAGRILRCRSGAALSPAKG